MGEKSGGGNRVLEDVKLEFREGEEVYSVTRR